MSVPPQPPGPGSDGPAPSGSPVGLDAATTQIAAEPADDAPEPPEVEDSEHNPSLEGLGAKLRTGAKFASVALVFTQLISLTQTIVIARILSPLEIGTFTLGTLFATFLTTMADGGMRAALIQREREVEDAANTAFWVGLGTGSAMALCALAASPVLGWYFDNPLVGVVCAVSCGTLLIHSLLNVPEALMQRSFNFKRRLVVDPTTATTFAVVAVTFCLLGFGVWGLVIGLYASQLATLISCWGLAKWRPGKGSFVFRIWREMAGYAAPLILSGVVDQGRDAIQAALVGHHLDVASAGQYRYGRRIGVLPGQAIIQVASYVLFPAFARIAADVNRFRDGMLRALQMLWVVTVPFAAVLIALGQPMIVVLLGEQWRPAGLFVAAMAGVGPGTAMGAIGIESIKGAGASRRINYLTVLSIVVGLGSLIALLPFGLVGVGLAASLDGIVGGFASIVLARRLAAASIGDLVRVLAPPLAAATAAGAAVGALEHLVVHSDQRPIVLGLLFLALEVLLLAAVFLGLLFLMAPEAVLRVRDALLRRTRGRQEAEAAEGEDAPEPRPRVSAMLDAPTEAIPIFAMDDPTGRIYSPYRWTPRPPRAMGPPAPPPGALPFAAPPPPRPPGPLVAPLSPEGQAERAARFEQVSVDAPTTAIRPVRSPRVSPTSAGSTTNASTSAPTGNGSTPVPIANGATSAATSAGVAPADPQDDAVEEPREGGSGPGGNGRPRLISMARVRAREQGGSGDGAPGAGRSDDPDRTERDGDGS
jgi:PST family polysaccharide transporter